MSMAMNLPPNEVLYGHVLIDFIYVNARHHTPLRRVVPFEIYDSEYYDREKYWDMVLEAAETVLSTFGFSKKGWLDV